MIQHTVSFTLRHPADSAEEGAFLADAAEILAAIPGVQDFRVSRQVSRKSDHRFQFAMDFVDDAAYARYNEHPAHVRFVETRWANEVADFQELDLVPLS